VWLSAWTPLLFDLVSVMAETTQSDAVMLLLLFLVGNIGVVVFDVVVDRHCTDVSLCCSWSAVDQNNSNYCHNYIHDSWNN
jgi:hypothetical protein